MSTACTFLSSSSVMVPINCPAQLDWLDIHTVCFHCQISAFALVLDANNSWTTFKCLLHVFLVLTFSPSRSLQIVIATCYEVVVPYFVFCLSSDYLSCSTDCFYFFLNIAANLWQMMLIWYASKNCPSWCYY